MIFAAIFYKLSHKNSQNAEKERFLDEKHKKCLFELPHNEIKCVLSIKELNFNEKMGQNFHICSQAEPRGLTTSLTVILTAKIKDDIKEMTNWHLTKLMTKEVTDPCSPQLLVRSLVSPVHPRNEYIFSVEFVFQIAYTNNLTAIIWTEMPLVRTI